MIDKKSFCLVPWFGVFVDSKSIGPCCVNYELSSATTIEEYLNSQELKDLKKDFLEGKKPQSCDACWKTEFAGISSVRQEKRNILVNEKNTLLKGYNNFNIRISNKCNYKCRMCHPRYSSAWELDKKASFLMKGTFYKVESFNIDKYKKNIQYILDIAKKHKVSINILGGEPLIADEFLYFLDKTKEYNVRSNIILNINTNLSVTKYKNKSFKDEFSTFDTVVMHASLDGLNSVGEYIRKGFKQSIFNNNLEYFKEYVKYLNITLQLYNIYDMPNIYKYAENRDVNIIINYLTIPNYLSISLLDRIERDNILKYYKYNNFYNKEIEDSLNNEKVRLKDLYKFINYTEGLDKLWKTDFKAMIPELKNWYERVKNNEHNMV